MRSFVEPLVVGGDVQPSGVFRGCHLAGARRFAIVMCLGGVVTIPTFLPFFPPTALSTTGGWVVSGLFLAKLVLSAAWLWARPTDVTFPRLVALLAADLPILGALQVLGGGWAQPYYTLFFVHVAAVALIIPARVMAFYLPATFLFVLVPVATGETAGATPDVLTGLVPWGLMTVLVIVVMTRVRSQRVELAGAARVDALTELPNRRALQAEAAGVLRAARQADGIAIVGVIDIDGFKQLNDHFGHLAGDASLRDVASTLAEVCGEGERAYRWGGDEFVVLLHARDELAAARRRDAVNRELVGATYDPEGEDVTVSVGWATDPGGAVLDELLDAADGTLRERKARRRVLR